MTPSDAGHRGGIHSVVDTDEIPELAREPRIDSSTVRQRDINSGMGTSKFLPKFSPGNTLAYTLGNRRANKKDANRAAPVSGDSITDTRDCNIVTG